MKENIKLYEKVYMHYRKLIESGKLLPDDKMPSIRGTVKELSVSKTTAENAYFQLVADGYIISKNKTGYFVTKSQNQKSIPQVKSEKTEDKNSFKYDLSVIGDDSDAFCFDLWQRYMKSALRNRDKLATYGMSQGEYELRYEISNYLRKTKNIYCNPDDIVIGASTQSLLMILLPILKEKGYKTASVPTETFKRYENVFESYDIPVDIRNKNADIIYVSPAHMTAWGELMSLKRRHEIAHHSQNGHFIIEDGYQSELNFSKKPSPTIYTLTGGENVVYIGSFSRVLLPSIRISYMILPNEISKLYKGKSLLYDQTASKTEQIALCMFMRDEKLNAHIKSVRRLYYQKREVLSIICNNACKNSFISIGKSLKAEVLKGDCGTEFGIRLYSESDIITETDIDNILRKINIKPIIQKVNENSYNLILSCGITGLDTLNTIKEEMEKN